MRIEFWKKIYEGTVKRLGRRERATRSDWMKIMRTWKTESVEKFERKGKVWSVLCT